MTLRSFAQKEKTNNAPGVNRRWTGGESEEVQSQTLKVERRGQSQEDSHIRLGCALFVERLRARMIEFVGSRERQ